jgi:hypothetical protein
MAKFINVREVVIRLVSGGIYHSFENRPDFRPRILIMINNYVGVAPHFKSVLSPDGDVARASRAAVAGFQVAGGHRLRLTRY